MVNCAKWRSIKSVNVFCPHTAKGLRPETRAALQGIATFIELSDGGFHDYRRYFIDRWNEGATFINVEHDVAPTRAQLEDLWRCPRPWCGFCYGAVEAPYLGCAKITAEFIAANRGLWTDHEATYDYWWGSLDAHIARTANLTFHLHQPPVRHRELLACTGNILPRPFVEG
jgi:hypothetical protein